MNIKLVGIGITPASETPVSIQSIDWLDRTSLGYGERLIRFTDGHLEGQLAVVCTTDDGAHENVYTQEDWTQLSSPSAGFDDDGDLVWFNADGSFGCTVIGFEDVEVSK